MKLKFDYLGEDDFKAEIVSQQRLRVERHKDIEAAAKLNFNNTLLPSWLQNAEAGGEAPAK